MAEWTVKHEDGVVTITDDKGVERHKDLTDISLQHFAYAMKDRDANRDELERQYNDIDYWRKKWKEWRDIALEVRADNARLWAIIAYVAECEDGQAMLDEAKALGADRQDDIRLELTEARADNTRLRGLLEQDEFDRPYALLLRIASGELISVDKDVAVRLRMWADAIDAALAGEECPCRSGGTGDDGLAKQPCDECDAATIMKERHSVTGAELNEARRQLEKDDAGEAKP